MNADEYCGGGKKHSEMAALGRTPADQFEQALTTAREEGNLSRANVVRKVKGKPLPSNGRSE